MSFDFFWGIDVPMATKKEDTPWVPTTQRPERDKVIPREEGPEREARLAALGIRLNPVNWVNQLAANDQASLEDASGPRGEPRRRAA